MPLLLAQDVIRIEEVPFWTIVPFVLVLAIALVLVVGWILRA